MPITPSDPFFWRHYEGEIILLCVRWYLSFPLSYRQMATIMAERGLSIHASCIWRWVQMYGPELEKRCRPHPRSRSASTGVTSKEPCTSKLGPLDACSIACSICAERCPKTSFDVRIHRDFATTYQLCLWLRTRGSHVRVMPGAFPFNHLQAPLLDLLSTSSPLLKKREA